MLEHVAAAVKAPANDSFRTFFYYLFMIISLTGFIAIAFLVMYTILKWIKKEYRIRRRRDRNARIRRDAIELARVLRARADLEVPG